jgi:hypothetical protein
VRFAGFAESGFYFLVAVNASFTVDLFTRLAHYWITRHKVANRTDEILINLTAKQRRM